MDQRCNIILCAIGFYAVLLRASEGKLEYKTIKQCTQDKIQGNLIETESNVTVIISSHQLYKMSYHGSWCEAYHFCRHRGQSMASIEDQETETSIQQALETADVQADVWVGGRRKDYGLSWTWVIQNLKGQVHNATHFELLSIKGKNSASLFIFDKKPRVKNDQNAEHWVCIEKGDIDIRHAAGVSWFEAQNQCHGTGGRLATLDEILASGQTIDASRVSFIGLYRHPWLWVKGNNTRSYRPVLFSAWDNETFAGDCMKIVPPHTLGSTSNGSWRAVNCSSLNQYVLCQAGDGKDDHESGWDTSTRTILVVFLVIVVLVLLITLGCILWRRLSHKQQLSASVFYRPNRADNRPADQLQGAVGGVPDPSCLVEMAAYRPSASNTPTTSKKKDNLVGPDKPKRQNNSLKVSSWSRNKAKAMNAQTLPSKLNKGGGARPKTRFSSDQRGFDMYEDVDHPTGKIPMGVTKQRTSEPIDVSDVYTAVIKTPGSRTSGGRDSVLQCEASGISKDYFDTNDDIIVDNEMYCASDDVVDDLGDDVMMFENENYGDVEESQYALASALLHEKKPAPAPKPSPDTVRKGEVSPVKPIKHYTIGGLGRRGKQRLPPAIPIQEEAPLSPLPEIQEVYAEVDKTRRNKSKTK